jgi:hypothetical protein
MKVTAAQKIEALTSALARLGYYREHDGSCQVVMTDFCTCGMLRALNTARDAVALEVEEAPNAL